jgi:hypothetical protein
MFSACREDGGLAPIGVICAPAGICHGPGNLRPWIAAPLGAAGVLGGVSPVRSRAAAERLSGLGPALVVADAGLVVREEHLAGQFSPAPDAGLAEDVIQVLLDGLSREEQPGCDG